MKTDVRHGVTAIESVLKCHQAIRPKYSFVSLNLDRHRRLCGASVHGDGDGVGVGGDGHVRIKGNGAM